MKSANIKLKEFALKRCIKIWKKNCRLSKCEAQCRYLVDRKVLYKMFTKILLTFRNITKQESVLGQIASQARKKWQHRVKVGVDRWRELVLHQGIERDKEGRPKTHLTKCGILLKVLDIFHACRISPMTCREMYCMHATLSQVVLILLLILLFISRAFVKTTQLLVVDQTLQ